jgi:NAD+ synthase
MEGIMNAQNIQDQIVRWLSNYCERSALNGFVVGISGGIDSAVTSTLCALTGKKTICLNLPLRQKIEEYQRSKEHIASLEQQFSNVSSIELNLTKVFTDFEQLLPKNVSSNLLSMANSRSRLRMVSLYAVGQAENLLVAGTGNKIEDFGIGFFTKYGDGGVDISPIADLYKTEVFALGKHLGVVSSILNAKPTDGLWEDARDDEDQIGASYEELEWAMKNMDNPTKKISNRQQEVLNIYRRLHVANKHKMEPIPFCKLNHVEE